MNPVQEPDQRVPPPLDLPRQRYVLLLFVSKIAGSMSIVAGSKIPAKNVIALPFSKLQFALSWITPRNDVVIATMVTSTARRISLSPEAEVSKRSLIKARRVVSSKPYGHRNQQINIAVWLQAAIHCGAITNARPATLIPDGAQ